MSENRIYVYCLFCEQSLSEQVADQVIKYMKNNSPESRIKDMEEAKQKSDSKESFGGESIESNSDASDSCMSEGEFKPTVKESFVGENETAFTPMIINHIRKKGINLEISKPFLPGYVFMYSLVEAEDVKWMTKIRGVIKVLGDMDNNYCLEGNDLKFAEQLYHRSGRVTIRLKKKEKAEGSSNEEVTGIKHIIVDDLLSDTGRMQLVRVDERKKRAKIKFTLKKKIYSNMELDEFSFTSWIAFEECE